MLVIDITHHSFIDLITNSSTELFVAEGELEIITDFVQECVKSCHNSYSIAITPLEQYVSNLNQWDFEEYVNWIDREENELHQIDLFRAYIPPEINNKNLIVLYTDNNNTDVIATIKKHFKTYEID